jgi:putative component of membrane protein insertase Oxa1/YidC/SpoIIIJ protein YidD
MIRQVLLAGIHCYRRRLSGRGPFARVRCTFAELESCSAFAERILNETPSAPDAVGRILRRLARCRHLSLYRLREGRLGWGRDYDVVLTRGSKQDGACRLDRALAADGESVLVRTALIKGAALVAAAAGVPDDARPTTAPPLPLIRDGEAARQAFTRRLRRRGLAALVAAGVGTAVFLAGGGALVVLPCFLVAFGSLVLTWTDRAALQRLEWLEVLAAIEGPRKRS